MAGDRLGGRILAVDILRGMTVCLMVIVNNGVGDSFPFLRHAEWNGMTPCDMVFPFFLFIMGVSVFLASRKSVRAVLRRTVLIILVCWAIYWFECILYGDWLPFGHFRLTGVLPRIALSYCIVALLSRRLRPAGMGAAAAVLLGLYSLLILLGNGYSNDPSNIISVVDRALLGQDHLYMKRPVDPEGLLGLIPSVAHTILGYLCGAMLKSGRPAGRKVGAVAAYGAVLLACGLVLSLWLPLNKRIWSPSFVLVTCGAAALLLSLLTYLLDIRGLDRGAEFFRVFGVNSLALYVLSEALSAALGRFDVPDALYDCFRSFLPGTWASLLYAVLFMLLVWGVGYALYRKKVFIKL